MEAGLLLIRLAVGLTFAAHGARRLFGAFGGPGVAGSTEQLAALGYRWPALAALAAGAFELTGGLLLAAGLATPVAVAGLAVVCLNVVVVVHRGRFFGRSELPLVLAAVSLGIAAAGPGRLSLDRLLGWDDRLAGLEWAAAALAVALLVSFFTVTWGRARAESTEAPA